MLHLPGAIVPFSPFEYPVTLPLPDIGDAPLVCVQINQVWMQYLIGCAEALTVQSTWRSDDENAVNTVIRRARNLIDVLAGLEACPMPVQFQIDPLDSTHWEYSTDGGATWLDGPLTTFPAAPTDYVKTDPIVDATQIIAGLSGVDTLQIQALAAFGAKLRSDRVAAFMEKDVSGSPSSDGVLQLKSPGSYSFPLIETVP